MKYLDPRDLKRELLRSQAVGSPTVLLCEMIARICRELNRHYAFTVEIEDAQQESILLLHKILMRVDAERGIFNYFTTVVLNLLRQKYRESKTFTMTRQRLYDRLTGKI